MRILSLFIGQDTSVSIIEDGKLAYFMPEERLRRKKDDYFWTDMMRDVFLNFDKHYDIVNLAYDLNEYYCIVKEVKKYIERFFEYKDLVIHDDRHHDFHALGGFYTSPFQEALCVVVDGGGSLYRKNFADTPISYLFNKCVLIGKGNFSRNNSISLFCVNSCELLLELFA